MFTKIEKIQQYKEDKKKVLKGLKVLKNQVRAQKGKKIDEEFAQCHLDKGLSLSKPSKNIKNILGWLFLLLYMPKNNIFGHDK